eukprot:360457-Chlamydomonas_euryale.AAC.3
MDKEHNPVTATPCYCSPLKQVKLSHIPLGNCSAGFCVEARCQGLSGAGRGGKPARHLPVIAQGPWSKGVDRAGPPHPWWRCGLTRLVTHSTEQRP